jgi:hypothetical protein
MLSKVPFSHLALAVAASLDREPNDPIEINAAQSPHEEFVFFGQMLDHVKEKPSWQRLPKHRKGNFKKSQKPKRRRHK